MSEVSTSSTRAFGGASTLVTSSTLIIRSSLIRKSSTARASFGVYSNDDDVAALIDGLARVERIFG